MQRKSSILEDQSIFSSKMHSTFSTTGNQFPLSRDRELKAHTINGNFSDRKTYHD